MSSLSKGDVLALKYAHHSGVGDICAHPSGSHIYTGGKDGQIRVFDNSLNQLTSITLVDPKTGSASSLADLPPPSITYMVLSKDGKRLATCCSNNYVYLFDVIESGSNVSFAGYAKRFNSPPHSVAFSPSGNQLACVADGSDIILVNANDIGDVSDIKLKAPVRHLTYAPEGRLLSVSDAHGNLRLIDLKSKETVDVLTVLPEIKSNEVLNRTQRLPTTWSPDGSLLAMPGVNTVQVYLRSFKKSVELRFASSTSTSTTSLNSSMHTSSALAFSSTGKYLAVAWTDGSLRVWDLTPSSSSTSTDPFSQQPLLVGSSSVSADSPVVSLNWSSTENALYAFTSKGYIAKWNDPVPSHRPSPFVTMTSTTTSSSANNTPSTPLNQPSPPSSTSISTTSTNVDERKIVNDVGSDSVDHAAQATEVVSRSNVADLMRDKDSDSDSSDDNSDDDDDDDSVRRKKKSKRIKHTDGSYTKTSGNVTSQSILSSGNLPQISLQPAFQPSSTPLFNNRCYLAWNMVGCVDLLNHGNHFNSITVTFADAEAHNMKKLNIKDHRGVTMAALGTNGVFFAAPGKDARNPSPISQLRHSLLAFHPFNSVDGQVDWVVALPPDEHPEAVAVGETWAAAATTMHYLRIFSFTLVQRYTISLPGPVVAMVGEGSTLAVVTHSLSSVPGYQSLILSLFDAETGALLLQQPLPISPQANLSWFGFSDSRMLVTSDSFGVYRSLMTHKNNVWYPILDARNLSRHGGSGSSIPIHRQDRPWPIAVLDNELLCIMCKAPQTHPNASSDRPVPSTVSLTLPFINTSAEEQLLEKVARARLMDKENALLNDSILSAKDIKKRELPFIKLIAMAARESPSRALDLFTHLEDAELMSAAIQALNLKASNEAKSSGGYGTGNEGAHYKDLLERMNLVLRSKTAQQLEGATAVVRAIEKNKSIRDNFSTPASTLSTLSEVNQSLGHHAGTDLFSSPTHTASTSKLATTGANSSTKKPNENSNELVTPAKKKIAPENSTLATSSNGLGTKRPRSPVKSALNPFAA